MESEKMLKEVKERRRQWLATRASDFEWLTKQAETLQKIADTWVDIETNGTSIDADNFYTIVQDILSDNEES